MSMTINLLPWREERRGQRTRKFYGWVAAMVVLGVGGGLLMAQFYQHQLAAQQQRNAYINDHMMRLNADIEGVSQYQQDADRLSEQLVVFQSLQSERLHTVQLFNDVAESVANGVVYQRLSKTGNSVSATAVAASERQVSDQLRRIAALPGLGVPTLAAVESDQQGSGRVFRFSVEQISVEQTSGEEAAP